MVQGGSTVTSADVAGEDVKAIAADLQERFVTYDSENPRQSGEAEPGTAQWSRTATSWMTNTSTLTIKGTTKRILKPQTINAKWIFWPE